MSTTRTPDFAFWKRKSLPVMMSGEISECGLVCLAMISSYWGHIIDLPSMRARFAVSMKGATFKGLMTMAHGLKLNSRPLKIPLERLATSRLPCVLHWDMNHFVVLKAIKGGSAIIHDPSVGARSVPMAELSKHYTGAALELLPATDFKRAEETKPYTLLSLAGRVVGLRGGLAQLLLLGLALQACTLVAPFYLQWIVDEALVASDRTLTTVLGVGFLLLVVMQGAISAVRAWAVTSLSASFNVQWLGNAFGHLLELPLTYFERRHVGDIVSRFGSIQTIQRSITTQLVEGVIDGLLVVGTLAVMLLYSVPLTLVSAAVVALYVGVRLSMMKAGKEAMAEQIMHDAKQHTHFLESARGIQSIRMFGRASERRSGWMNTLADRVNAELRTSRITVTYTTIHTVLFGSERILVIWLAALAVMDARFSVGMLFAFLAYKEQFTARTTSLIDKIVELKMLKLHGDRVADIVMADAEEAAHNDEVDINSIEPSIEFRNVSFRYSDGEPYVLRSIDLKIAAGESIAITGVSGCGKTTLLKLLLGLLVPTEGEVLVGGRPLKSVGLANFRRMVGSVMQDDTLFSGSVGENISFFDTVADQARVIAVAKLAAMDEEISAMPMGYNTIVGDNGIGISGGQRQRLLLARAMYGQPKILTLDEATSHLDVANEQHVNAAIKRCEVTRVVVAHRPETISMASRVVVLEDGRIVRDMELHNDARHSARVASQGD